MFLLQIYRLQSSVRGAELGKKGSKAEEKKLQHELMQTMRASNDIISELTSRMRRAEEKLHIDRESRKNMIAQTKQFEQVSWSIVQAIIWKVDHWACRFSPFTSRYTYNLTITIFTYKIYKCISNIALHNKYLAPLYYVTQGYVYLFDGVTVIDFVNTVSAIIC